MFSSLTHRLGTRALDRLGLIVELSTLGEYGVDCHGVFALCPSEDGAARTHAKHSGIAPRAREDCPYRGRFTQVGGGTARP